MTNEELAVQIQAGEKELLIVLWKQIERLIIVMAKRYARREGIPAFIDVEDFKQCGYFAMLKAIEAFKAENGYKFTTYLKYAMINAARDMLGLRSGKRRVSGITVSLNDHIGDEEDAELQDLVPDDSVKIGEDLEREEIKQAIWEEIEKLPQDQAYIVVQHWFKNKTYTDIAAKMGVSHFDVMKIVRRALQRMGRSRRLYAVFCIYYNGMCYSMVECSYIGERLTKEKRTEMSGTDVSYCPPVGL